MIDIMLFPMTVICHLLQSNLEIVNLKNRPNWVVLSLPLVRCFQLDVCSNHSWAWVELTDSFNMNCLAFSIKQNLFRDLDRKGFVLCHTNFLFWKLVSSRWTFCMWMNILIFQATFCVYIMCPTGLYRMNLFYRDTSSTPSSRLPFCISTLASNST